ncbi:MAG: hypothetical protein GC150_03825 [Rhizobiales bacterium]|nr:hypothetical protein [Hyphomicrobiales bacterium]
MGYRIIAIVALIAILVLAANGHLHRWLGLEGMSGNQAGLLASNRGIADLRAVQGWASSELAAEVCGLRKTDAAEALKEGGWDEDPAARKAIAEVRKQLESASKEAFCATVWAEYGPNGSKIADLLAKPAT